MQTVARLPKQVNQILLLLTFLLLQLPALIATESLPHTLDISPPSSINASANTSVAWSLLLSRSTFLPTARYGHSSIGLSYSIAVTHGYQFDHSTSTPLWLSDTWSYSLSNHQWRQVFPPCTERQVVGGVCPCGRMGAVWVVDGERAYMYGGDDGGASRGQSSYAYNLFADLWSVPLSSLAADATDSSAPAGRWQHENTSVDSWALSALGYSVQASASAASVAHAQHSAYVRRVKNGTSEIVVFGGMIPRARDNHTTADSTADASVMATNTVWRLPLSAPADRQWQLMSCNGGAPAARYGHTMAGVEQSADSHDAVYVYGGFARGKPNFGDLWRLLLPHNQPTHCEWLLLSPPEQHSQQPTARGYATMLASQRFVLMFGGSHCAPGCECSREVWAFDVVLHEWIHPQLVSTEQPQARYKHTAVTAWMGEAERSAGACMTVYVFGGESYKPQKYHSDVWRLRYSHIGGAHTCESAWEIVLGERSVLEVTAWSIVLLLAVAVMLLLRRRVLREIKTS